MGAQNQESLRWETPHSELLHSSLKNGEPLPCTKQYVALWKTVALPLCCAQKMSPGDKQPLVPVEKQLLLCSDPCPQHAAPTASTAHNPSPTRPSIMLSPLHTARGSKPRSLPAQQCSLLMGEDGDKPLCFCCSGACLDWRQITVARHLEILALPVAKQNQPTK